MQMAKNLEKNFLIIYVKLVSPILNMHIKNLMKLMQNLSLSYFKYHKRLNWVIAAGVYIDDIEE